MTGSAAATGLRPMMECYVSARASQARAPAALGVNAGAVPARQVPDGLPRKIEVDHRLPRHVGGCTLEYRLTSAGTQAGRTAVTGARA
jgi:hypothetical protein